MKHERLTAEENFSNRIVNAFITAGSKYKEYTIGDTHTHILIALPLTENSLPAISFVQKEVIKPTWPFGEMGG